VSAEEFGFGGRDVCVIDLSQRLSNATTAFEPMPHSIEYFDHTDTIAVSEEMFGLGAVPLPPDLEAPFGFQVLALPVRLERASGAWARVVALVPAG
jgi:kynurenine formamidase